jgi:hypothetical protein
MKVRELIQLLQAQSGDKVVVIPDCSEEGRFAAVASVQVLDLVTDDDNCETAAVALCG